MPEAEITIQTPENTWIDDVSRGHPELTFTVNSAVATETEGTAVVEIDIREYDDVLQEIRDHSTISYAEVIAETEKEVLLQIDTPEPVLLHQAQEAGVPVEMPVEIQDGEGTWRLRASRERLSNLTSAFAAMGVEHTVDYVGDVEPEDDEEVLTERQRHLVKTALKTGYYDTPRTATLEDVAGEMDLAKSTCSEILHRAEGKVLEWYVRDS